MNVDPKKGDQNIRTTCLLPEGMGKVIKVAVYANDSLLEKAKQIGADMVVDKQMLENVFNK